MAPGIRPRGTSPGVLLHRYNWDLRTPAWRARTSTSALAQMRSVDRIELSLYLEAKRKTSTRDEYFAF
jgi:hypothetical protein